MPCFYFRIIPQAQECKGFVCEVSSSARQNIRDCRLKLPRFLPTGCQSSVGLIAGICKTKCQSPHHSPGMAGGGGGGGGLGYK